MGLGSMIANYAENKAQNAFGDVVEEGGRIDGHIQNGINDVKGYWGEGVCQEDHEHGEGCCPPCGHTEYEESCETCTEYESSWTTGGGGGGVAGQPAPPPCGHPEFDETCQSCSDHMEQHWDQSGSNPPPCGHEAVVAGCWQCEEHQRQCWAGNTGGASCGHEEYDESCEQCAQNYQ